MSSEDRGQRTEDRVEADEGVRPFDQAQGRRRRSGWPQESNAMSNNLDWTELRGLE